MRKPLLFALLLLFAAVAAQAQHRVSGTLKDTVGKTAPAQAVIALLQKKDSALVTFTRSDAAGRFRTAPVPPGSYVLLVTYPKFADLADVVTVKDADLDLGTVALTPKSVLLNEVVIRANNAIRQRGDTTEFTADSFKVREGATVEELLRKLPGFSVNAKGEITTQGKKVDKVLVDGEEFFGDDPTMATQNIASKMVDKVQVYDTKSEQQSLTSIGTGNEGKTLNIKLKEDKKKGSFGKVSAGTDFTDYMEARGLYNRFVGKKKLSAYATHSNVSTGSLNWEDKQKLGIENDMEYDEISGFYYSFGSNDEFSDWGLRGYPESWTGGALYSDKWNGDRQGVNGSYRYNRLGTTNGAYSTTQNILPGNLSTRTKDSYTRGTNEQHALNAKYEFKIDSLTTIKYTAAGTYKQTEQSSNTYSMFRDDTKNELINESNQNRTNATTHKQLDQQLNWRQAFMKKGRLMILNLRHGITTDDQRGVIRTDQSFYENNLLDSTSLVDQMRKVDGRSRTIGGKLTWNEPLSSKWNLVLEYGHNENRSRSFRNTFNKSNNGKYESLDTVFSNNFELDALSNVGNVTFKYMNKKVRFAAGSGLSQVQLRLHNLFTDVRSRYNFTNFTPQVQFGITPKPQSGINLSYRGSTRQPTIDQLQPIRDNNDPLNVFVGNPDLKVGFNHTFSLGMNQFKALKQRYFWFNGSYTIVEDAIAFTNTVDLARGKQTYTPVNVDGNRNWNFWSSWNADGGEGKWGFGFRLNGNGSRNVGFINGLRNVNNFTNLEFGPNIGIGRENKFNFNISPEVGFNTSRSSLQPDRRTTYFTYGGNLWFNLHMGKKWEFYTNAEVQVRQKVAAFAGTPDNWTINAGITRKVFKDNSGKLMLTVDDLLNQNVGFNRSINSNFINEERYSRVARYVMLRFEWSFTKMAGAK